MTDKELNNSLVALTKEKDRWEESIDGVAALLNGQSSKITGKALWLLGEMGLRYPQRLMPYLNGIAAYLSSEDSFLRERATNALGRIGRTDFALVEPYMERLLALAEDESPGVRLAFIWASENIATNTPEVFAEKLPRYTKLLHDENDRVRIEAPEILRVLGKRKPEYVKPYLDELKHLSESDSNSVVRIHAKGAIRAYENTIVQ